MELFNAIKNDLGDVNIIAEDLGDIFDSVKELLRDTDFPECACSSSDSTRITPITTTSRTTTRKTAAPTPALTITPQ